METNTAIATKYSVVTEIEAHIFSILVFKHSKTFYDFTVEDNLQCIYPTLLSGTGCDTTSIFSGFFLLLNWLINQG